MVLCHGETNQGVLVFRNLLLYNQALLENWLWCYVTEKGNFVEIGGES